MTYSTSYDDAFQQLSDAGVDLHFFEGQDELYIHAKVILADGTDAYVGSTNFSGNSMNFNRELGLQLSGADAVAVLVSTFQADLKAAPYSGYPPASSTTTTTSPAGASADGSQSPLELRAAAADSTTFPAFTCGNITLPKAAA
jgi:phosphatidylserine/phosphatidylglycerophosphate/cardiolipin synthase-like enzyme